MSARQGVRKSPSESIGWALGPTALSVHGTWMRWPARRPRGLQDTKLALKPVEDHIALLGKAPRAHAHGRGGYGVQNVTTPKRPGSRKRARVGR